MAAELRIEVVEGRSLARMDLLSKSDPFAAVRVSGISGEKRTRVVKNNLNPRWAEFFTFPLPADSTSTDSETIYLEVWDHNRFSKPDFMGRVLIPLGAIEPNTKYDDWFELAPRKASKKVKKLGEIHLRIERVTPSLIVVPASAQKSTDSASTSGVWTSADVLRRSASRNKSDSDSDNVVVGKNSTTSATATTTTAKQDDSTEKLVNARKAQRREATQQLDEMEARIEAAARERAIREATAEAAAEAKAQLTNVSNPRDDDDTDDPVSATESVSAAAKKDVPAVLREAEEAVAAISQQSSLLAGTPSLKELLWDANQLRLTVRLNNFADSSSSGASDEGNMASTGHSGESEIYSKPGLYVAINFTSDYPKTRPLVRAKANDGNFDQDVVAGLILVTTEFSKDPVVSIIHVAAYMAQQFSARFPMRGLGMSMAVLADDFDDDLSSDADIWEGELLDDAPDDKSYELGRDALKLADLFGAGIGVTAASRFETTININPNFLDAEVALAIGVDRSVPIVFEIVWSESYMFARSVPKFELFQPGNKSFAVQFQLKQVMSAAIESCMEAVQATKDIDKAISQVMLPQGLDEAAGIRTRPAFSSEVLTAVQAGHTHLAAALALLSARHAGSAQPLVDATALLTWSQYDFASPSKPGDEPGARWNRIVSSYNAANSADQVPARSAGVLNEIVAHLIFRLRDITGFCMVCDAKLEGSGLKPTVCSQELCVFRHEELGLGSKISNELSVDADVVDLMVNLSYSSAQNAARRDLVFSPFPPEYYVGDTGKLDEDKRVKDFDRLCAAFDAIPSISVLESCNGDEQQIRQILDVAGGYVRGQDDNGPPSPYVLLRWTLNTIRCHLVKLSQKDTISEMNTPHQYVMLSAPPARRAKFSKLRQEFGSFFAWHGSSVENWHAIMRNGLRNLSNTKLMTCGAAYGAGIYLSPWSDTSRSYARKGKGWSKSRFGGGDLQIVTLCEVINHPDLKGQPNPHYVIQDEDFIVTRFLLVYLDGANIPRVDSRTLDKYRSRFE